MKYLVRAKINFNDYEGREIRAENKYTKRNKGDLFYCSRERYLYLKEHNAVELMAIEKAK